MDEGVSGVGGGGMCLYPVRASLEVRQGLGERSVRRVTPTPPYLSLSLGVAMQLDVTHGWSSGGLRCYQFRANTRVQPPHSPPGQKCVYRLETL